MSQRLAEEAVTVNPRDSVLRRVFMLGEKAAKPVRAASPAVGLTGDPPRRGWARVALEGKAHAVYRDEKPMAAVAAVAAVATLPRQPGEWRPAQHHVESYEIAGW